MTRVPLAPTPPGAAQHALTRQEVANDQQPLVDRCDSVSSRPWVAAASPSPLKGALVGPGRPAIPEFFLSAKTDGPQELLRYATINAAGESENHLSNEMPEGALVDYAMRGAIEAFMAGADWKRGAVCPLGLHLFVDPVIAPDGHTYERRYIVGWLREHHTSPATGISFAAPGAANPQTVRLISHTVMRQFATWVLANDPPTDALDDDVVPLRATPPLFTDAPLLLPPRQAQAVAVNNLQGAQAPVPVLPLLGSRTPIHPGRALCHITFCTITLASYGCMTALATRSDSVQRGVGCGLTFASTLAAAIGTLSVRHWLNRSNRAQGRPLV